MNGRPPPSPHLLHSPPPPPPPLMNMNISTTTTTHHRHTRPATPESTSHSLTNSLYNATHTIDELTAALTEFSQRVPSPDLPQPCLACCCGRETSCENLANWLATKGKLEDRLRLSAEVGQALLQRHEAYVRRHEITLKRQTSISKSIDSNTTDDVLLSSNEEMDAHISELLKEKNLLEKRLNQALVNNEVSEVSTKSILQELEEARATISRLTASHARSTGWDVRLSVAMKDRDDMQQERDIESQRARLAESRFAALKDKAAKLQMEVRRLQESLESKRLTHLESSESTLKNARSRIQLMQSGPLSQAEHDDLTRVMESLVNDNEILKRDNAELQHLLSDCREDLHVLQEEVEEQRVNRTLRHKRSMAESLSGKDYSMPAASKRDTSLDRDLSAFEPLTPETNRRPLSPTTHISISTPSEPQWPHVSAPGYPSGDHGPYLPQLIYELDSDGLDGDHHDDGEHVEKPISSDPIFVRSRSVQTLESGAWPRLTSSSLPYVHFRQSTLPPSHPHSHGLHHPGQALTSSDPRSESSSFTSETLTSHIAMLLERMYHLFTKLSQTDALTLTNRLKRQHLYRGPREVKHLSRSSVNQILNELALLRVQFRVLLEDEKTFVVCTRKEVRLLFRLVKEMLGEMGRTRVVLNDVILDPGEAQRISEAAMDPSKAGEGRPGKEGWDWMAPLSKLFTPGNRAEKHDHQKRDELCVDDEAGGITRSVSGRSGVSGNSNLGNSGLGGSVIPTRPRTIMVPKIAPALGATPTTVNVEFLAAGVKGKSVTNTFASTGAGEVAMSASPGGGGLHGPFGNQEGEWQTQTQTSSSGLSSGPGMSGGGIAGGTGTKGVMDIFVGAPARNTNALGDSEQWVVLPKVPRKVKSTVIRDAVGSTAGSSTGQRTGRSTPALMSGNTGEDRIGGIITGLSRYVDAVIDPVFRGASGVGKGAYIQPPPQATSSLASPMPPRSPARGEDHKPDEGDSNDNEQDQNQEPVFRPRLRRGLSDSSIHSTFSSHGHVSQDASPGLGVGSSMRLPPASGVGIVPDRQPKLSTGSSLWPDRQAVFQALSRTVQNLRLGPGGNGPHHAGNSAASRSTGGKTSAESNKPATSTAASTSNPGSDQGKTKSNAANLGKKRAKPRPSAPPSSSSGGTYYPAMNTVSGTMGAAALLSSMPAPPSMRDPYMWEA